MRTSRCYGLVILVLVGAMCFTTGCRKKKVGEASIEPLTDGKMVDVGTPVPGRDVAPTAANIIKGLNFSPVHFDFDSANVNPSERNRIEAVAEYIKKEAGVYAMIEGHCDERGSAEYNLALGERRAQAVRAYLIGLGIDGSTIQTKSYGRELPVHQGHDEAAWAENRRGEFVLFKP